MVAACVALLVGCGGGGEDAPDNVASANTANTSVTQTSAASAGNGTAATLQGSGTPASSPTPTTPAASDDGNPFNDAPAADTGTTPIAKQSCGIASLAGNIIALLNAERARGASCGSRGNFVPAGPLGWDTRLENAAIGHSQDMVANNLFSHVSSDGTTLAVRVDATGYQWLLLGENIAAGYDTPQATVAAWMASDGHCANVMNEQFEDIALACIPGTSATRYRNYWTLNFGRPR